MKAQNIYSAAAFFCAVVLTSISGVSCAKSTDAETMRLYVRASDAYSQGNFLEVIEILKKQNNFPPALILRAKAEYFFGDLQSAKKTCRRVLKLRPSSIEAQLYLARILREERDLAGAQEITESMLADSPQDIRILRFAAELAADSGKYDEASALLDRASEYTAEGAMVLLDRARLRWVSGRAEEALEDITRAKAMLPWDTPLMRSMTSLEKLISEAK
ncbi:MAG: tetratricopeptide repeat protein [Treponema sp.]|nr:tetratricopeptide repeat protein [Treponema sp.]